MGAILTISRALEGHGRQVFCPDIVGRGKSAWLANPADYNYAQYLTDMMALIARTGAESVDWVGTSMGGHIGMLLAAEANAPIRRLVINDIGPFIPLVAIRRVGAYVGQSPVFNDLEGVEKHMREAEPSMHKSSTDRARKSPPGLRHPLRMRRVWLFRNDSRRRRKSRDMMFPVHWASDSDLATSP